MAFTPVVFAIVAVVSINVLDRVAQGWDLGADVSGWWLFVTVFGGIAFVPGICLSLAGAIRLGRRGGTVLALVGLVLLSLPAVALGLAGFNDAVNGPSDPTQPHWTARLTLSSATLYAVPFALLLLGDLYAARAVWSTRLTRMG